MTTSVPSTKSGLRTLKPGEVLFNDGEPADSLFIIQKGQVRLFKPKGKGFIELAVLRSGEVIGEMAYFDEDGSGRKRSCSVAAVTTTEVIEISFIAFGKTMQSLNPWFKTIINTLVARLRKTNFRVKELEDNQAVSYGSKSGSYEFIKSIEVMRILGTLFLVFRAHGEVKSQALVVNRRTLTLYTQDMYQIMEVKLESLLDILVNFGWLEIQNDEDKMPNALHLKNIDIIRQIFIFYNSERHLPDDKQMKVGEKCEMLIAKMIERGTSTNLIDIPNLKVIDGVAPKFTKFYDMTAILNDFKSKGIVIHADHVDDGKVPGLFGEVVMQEGKVLVETDFTKILKMYPIIRFMNAIKKLNVEKMPPGQA